MNKNLLRVGVIGWIVAAVCCSSPLLIIFFGAVGLSSIIGYIDYVLLPLLVIFLGIIFYALKKSNPGSA